ncbi:preprotein translocase subunit SecY [Candidatus Micrarchaeota archaeon]|nr:preprotein translocase subunit SecY [Candidatus Micrarchaeota archaeon]
MGTLDFLKPALRFLPEIKAPQYQPRIQERLIWVLVALLAFFIMYNIPAVGVNPARFASIDFLQVVTASRMGSLLTTGIGPIVLASIFLQLFAGAKIIKVDMSNPEEKATFQGAQKLLAIALCFVEAAIYILASSANNNAGGFLLEPPFFGSLVAMQAIVILQIALGSLILLYLDEIVSKYGIGSGISLFIAAGVSLSVVGGTINLLTGQNGVVDALLGGGAEALPSALIVLLPLFFTAVVFLVVVYAEGIKVEIPLAFERARGLGSRFPIKFLYVSNIPVILASALMLNLSFMAPALEGKHMCIGGDLLEAEGVCSGGVDLVQLVGFSSGGRMYDGLLYFISPIYHPANSNFGAYMNLLATSKTPLFGIPEYVHVITYVIFMMVLCVLFGKFWVETANMSARDVATQLDNSGLQIPGFRRDPRIIERILERYIPTITILGSAFVGLLAALADMTGALGTGTGILLTVGILHKFYEDLEARNAFDSMPVLSKLFGN